MTAGTYIVTVQDEKSCQQTLSVVVGIGPRLGLMAEKLARLEPNPAQTWTRFVLQGSTAVTELSLLDATGAVHQQWMNPAMEGGSLVLELNNLPAGWYWVQYRHEGGIGRVPLVITD